MSTSQLGLSENNIVFFLMKLCQGKKKKKKSKTKLKQNHFRRNFFLKNHFS